MTQVTRELIELAERVEKAEGADRRLDAEIEVATVGFPERAFQQRNSMRPRGEPALDRMEWLKGWGVPAYTASIDAAMSLIDASTFFHLSRFDGDADGRSEAHVYPNRNVGDDYKAEAATPALALVAAALRARSAATL